MKKFLAVSTCTLVVSLSSIFGLIGDNQTQAVVYAAETTNINATKAVNLSGCKSVKQVVTVLKKSGCSNAVLNKVKNLKSVNSAVKYINSNKKLCKSLAAANVKAQTPTTTTTKPSTTKPSTTTTNTTTKPTASTSTNSTTSSYANEVLKLVNAERAKAGLSAFTTNSSLTAAANKRAVEIKSSFSHTRPNGSGFQTVLGEYSVSYRAAGENIAYGQKTPQAVVTGWMNSPGHRANILNANFNKLGVGVYQSNGTIYWTQEFTN
ncbi:MAG: putative secreted protein [Herbinix sp.]|nr:putative secreted protein [Herbinix sp.]